DSGTAAAGKGYDLEHPHPPMKGDCDNAADAYLLARLLDAPAVDADVAGGDQALRGRAAFDQPDAVQIAVDPHFLSLASSAKAWDGAARRSSGDGRRPRHFHASPDRVKPISLISRAIASSESPREVASATSTGLSPPAERTLRAWLASRSARSIRSHSRPSR